jgi:16S rRNA (adenine1518-N6/adenine1519-N6)-dimethyltransferase
MKRSRRQALGQHFLTAPGLLRKIVRALDPHPDEVILEIGPGRGSLTALLDASAGRVIGVEKDPRLIPGLTALGLERTVIVQADILKADWALLLREYGQGYSKAKLVGNIPYVISSPLMAKVLQSPSLFLRAVFLVQKEFALRLASGPGSKSFGPLSILFQRFFFVEREFPVSAGAFSPPPRVESEVISLAPRPAPEQPVDDESLLSDFLHASFSQRRKTLANNLESRGLEREAVLHALRGCGLDPKVRAEDVAPCQFMVLFDRLRSGLAVGRVSGKKRGRRSGGLT